MRACHPIFSLPFAVVLWLLVVNKAFALPKPGFLPGLLVGRQTANVPAGTTTGTQTGVYDEILKRMQLPSDNKDVYMSLRTKDEVQSFYRNAYHVLGDSITAAQQNLSASTSSINLYSDLTVFDKNTVVLPPKANIFLYTREISSTDGTNTLTLQYTEDMSFAILGTTNMPKDFKIKFVDANKTIADIEKSVSMPKDAYGVVLELPTGASDVSISSLGAPDMNSALEAFNYMGDLKASNGDFAEDDLPRLLQFQLLIAQMWMDSNRDLAMSILKFVRNTASSSPPAYQLYMQATTLLGRLSITNDKTESYVPNIDLDLTKTTLDQRLAYAKNFEDAYEKYAKEEVDDANSLALAQTLYQNSADVVTQYAFLADDAEKKMQAAEKALNVATEKFKDLNGEMASLQGQFQTGLAKWEAEETLKMVGLIIAGVIELVAEVAFAFVGGEGAAAGGGGATGTIATAAQVEQGVQSAERMVSTAAKISKFLAKIKPTVEAVGRATRIVKITMSELDELRFKEDGEFENVPEQPKTPTEIQQDLDAQFDIPNINADWDEFRNNVQMQFEQVKALNPELSIEGSLEYFEALFNLPDLGQAILAAQTAYMTVADEYARAMLQKATAESQTKSLADYKDKLSASAIKPTFKKAMWDRLVSTRSWVALDFNNYVAAYRYFTLDMKITKKISVPIMSPSTDYEQQVLFLQESINAAKPIAHSQTDIIEIRASDPSDNTTATNVFPPNWQKQLAAGELLFQISPNHPQFSSVTRVRIVSVRAYLIGSQSANVDLTLSNSGHFLDRTSDGAVAFVSDPTSLGFRYKPSANDPILPGQTAGVLTDGKFTTNDLMLPAPFSDWTLTLKDAANAVKGVTDLALEFQCEVTRN